MRRARAISARIRCVCCKKSAIPETHISCSYLLRWRNIFSIALLARIANKRQYTFHAVCIIHYDKFKRFYSMQRIAHSCIHLRISFSLHSQRVYFYFRLLVKLGSNIRTYRIHFRKRYVIEITKSTLFNGSVKLIQQTFYISQSKKIYYLCTYFFIHYN